MKQWKLRALPKLKRLFAGPSIVHKYKSCERKVRYSKESAVLAAAAMKDRHGEEFDAYECQYCRGYHVGHSLSISVSFSGEEHR